MLDNDLRKLLIAQIGNELSAHQLYMAISVYSMRQPRAGGKLFQHQAIEEAQHAQKIIDFLSTTRSTSTCRLKSESTRFESALGAPGRALKSEKDVAEQFDRMAAAAANGDHRGSSSSSGSSRSRSRRRRSSSRSSTSSTAASTCSRRSALLGPFE